MKFNTAVAAMMEFINYWQEKGDLHPNEAAKFLQILSPFAPYITEELWQKLGHKFSIHSARWPEFDPGLIQDEVVQVVIQINGKLRDRITIDNSRSLVEKEVKRMAESSRRTRNYLEGKRVKRVFFVPGKLINFVV